MSLDHIPKLLKQKSNDSTLNNEDSINYEGFNEGFSEDFKSNQNDTQVRQDKLDTILEE